VTCAVSIAYIKNRRGRICRYSLKLTRFKVLYGTTLSTYMRRCYISPLPSDLEGNGMMFKTSIFGTINWTMIYHFDQPLKKNLQEQNEPTPGSNVSSTKRNSIPRASLILLSSLLLTITTSCTLHFPIVAKLYRRHGLLFFLI
jgi:hypothetical protein